MMTTKDISVKDKIADISTTGTLPSIKIPKFWIHRLGYFRASWDPTTEKSSFLKINLTDLPSINEERLKLGIPSETIEDFKKSNITSHNEPIWLPEFFKRFIQNLTESEKNVLKKQEPIFLTHSKTLSLLSFCTTDNWKSSFSISKVNIEGIECICIFTKENHLAKSFPNPVKTDQENSPPGKRSREATNNSTKPGTANTTMKGSDLIGYCGERYLTSEDVPPYDECKSIYDNYGVTSMILKESHSRTMKKPPSKPIEILILNEVDARKDRQIAEIKTTLSSKSTIRKAFYGGTNLFISTNETAQEIHNNVPEEGVSVKFNQLYLSQTRIDPDFNRSQQFVFSVCKKLRDIFRTHPDYVMSATKVAAATGNSEPLELTLSGRKRARE